MASQWRDTEDANIRRWNEHCRDLNAAKLDKLLDNFLDPSVYEDATAASMTTQPSSAKKQLNGQAVKAWATYLHVRPLNAPAGHCCQLRSADTKNRLPCREPKW